MQHHAGLGSNPFQFSALPRAFRSLEENRVFLSRNPAKSLSHVPASCAIFLLLAMLTGARPFSGPSLPFCLPVIATRSIVLSIGAESSG
jgi:hypothetical protein